MSSLLVLLLTCFAFSAGSSAEGQEGTDKNCPPLFKPRLEANKCDFLFPVYDESNNCVNRFDCLIYAKRPFDLYDAHLLQAPNRIYGGCRWVYGVNPRTGNEEQAELCYSESEACPNLDQLPEPNYGCAYSFYIDGIGCLNAQYNCNEASKLLWPSRNPEVTIENSAPEEIILRNNIEDGEDVHAYCCNWAFNGECDANPIFMRARCQYSCGTPGCQMQDALNCKVQLNIAACEISEIQSDEPPCRDHALRCPIWGLLGECKKNASFMHTSCCKTCRKPEIMAL